MWTLNILKTWLDHNGVLISKTVYSGFGEGLNNSAWESIRDVGPIPQGLWDVFGPPFDTAEHGPYVLRVEPRPGTNTFGRVGFLMHGDEREHPGEHLASHGCIVADRVTRTRVYQSGDTFFRVISGFPTSQETQQP